jgi:hypothetical protein
MVDAVDDTSKQRTTKSTPGFESAPLADFRSPVRHPKLKAKAKRMKLNQGRKVKILCPGCGQKVRVDHLVRHLAKHSGLVLCPQNGCWKILYRRNLEHHLLEHGPKPRPTPGLPKDFYRSSTRGQPTHAAPSPWKSVYVAPPEMGQLPQWHGPSPRPTVAPRATCSLPSFPTTSSNHGPDSRCEIGHWIVPASNMPQHMREECPGRIRGVVRLPFRLLPPGVSNVKDILEYYLTEARGWLGKRTVDEERLRRLDRLEPSRVSVGTTEYRGYVLFEFLRSSAVVLECPVEGNATYILWDDWRGMLQMTKSEMRERANCLRIVHSNRSFDNIIVALDGHSATPTVTELHRPDRV